MGTTFITPITRKFMELDQSLRKMIGIIDTPCRLLLDIFICSKELYFYSNKIEYLIRMSDVSDPEDEIVDSGPARPQACSGDHQPAHGHAHGHPRVVRQPIKPPPGSDRWPAIYPVYLNSLRTREQVKSFKLFCKVIREAMIVLRNVFFKYRGLIWIEIQDFPQKIPSERSRDFWDWDYIHLFKMKTYQK